MSSILKLKTQAGGSLSLSVDDAIATDETFDVSDVYTKAEVEALIAARGLGVNQTWQDMTSVRAMDITYTNTTGIPISISIEGRYYPSTTGWAGLLLKVDGVILSANASDKTSSGYVDHTVSIIVPNGSTYLCGNRNVPLTSFVWHELRGV